MKALFRKDIYEITTSLKSVILIWLIFPIVAAINPNASYFVLYIGLLAGTLSSTLISYEEREKWPLFAGTLPVSRKQIVTISAATPNMLPLDCWCRISPPLS